MNEWVTVARVAEFGSGERRVVELDDTQVVVFKLGGQYYAIEDVCTHDGGRLTGGAVEGDQIVCPRHSARFCIRTVAALSAPACEPTSTFPVRMQDGVIQVRDDRWD